MVEKRGDFLVEVSWEVCNKVGGIHTVLTSKAASMKSIYGDNYFAVGPYLPKSVRGVFEESPIPEDIREFCNKTVCDDLKKEGIIIHYGKWLIDGEPSVILIDFLSWMSRTDELKKWLWDVYGVDSLRTGFDYDEVVVWSYCVGKVIETISKYKSGFRIVAQFHEWISGTALLYLKNRNCKVGTVFTTHATMLGRSLASKEVDIYNNMERFDVNKEAYGCFCEAKHMVEAASAKNSDVFTTVSEITGLEAGKFLGRKPDVLLPNGLNIDKYKTFEETSIDHRDCRDKDREFLLKYFFPYYKFEVKDTLFFFTACRYEFKVKGIDMFIKALGRLNKLLKDAGSKKTIIAFFFVPSDIRGIREEVLNNMTLFKDIKDDIEDHLSEIKSNIIEDLLSKKEISKTTIFDEDLLLSLKRKVAKISKEGIPSLSTHDLKYGNDAILNSFVENGLTNKKEDKVKVIFYPIYLSGADGLLDLNYEQGILASHLGVFPSTYEPWGYTTLESCALGVASMTTDLTGFGRFIVDKVDKEVPGAFVLNAMGKSRDDVVAQLTNVLFNFAKLSKKDRVKNKMAARKIAELADWDLLVGNYVQAHNLALEKKGL